MNFKQFEQLPLMGIVRGLEADMLEALVKVIQGSGLQTVEVTMNTQGAAGMIKALREQLPGHFIGAGTVLSLDQLKRALDAGACFIVAPNLDVTIVSHCRQHNIAVFPGAFTPGEIYNAWQAGASMVKIFPSKFHGPAYIKEMKGPFNQIKMMACGGVTPETITDFFEQGADAVAFGGQIFDLDAMRSGQLKAVTDRIKQMITNFGNLAR